MMPEQTEMPFKGPDDDEDPTAAVEALIGREGIDKLKAAGFLVARTADFDRFEAETEARVERLIKVAKVTMEAAKARTFIFEIRASVRERTSIEMILCDPGGDEEAMAKKIAAALKLVTHHMPKADRKAKRAGGRG